MLKSFIITCLLLGGLSSPLFANPDANSDHIVHFNLSLGGYQIGMPFDEATLVRPFALIETHASIAGREITTGSVNQVYINDIEFRFNVEFVDARVYKVIGQFSPEQLEKLREMLFEALGESEPDLRVVTSGDGEEFRLYHDRWQFPDASLELVGTEKNSAFATLALTAVGRQERARRDEQRQATAPAGTADTR